MRALRLVFARFLPWITRYFILSNAKVDRIKPGLATLIRKKGRLYSYLYMVGEMDARTERIQDTSFFWGPWIKSNMRRNAPVAREIDELEAFIMIRRADASKGEWCLQSPSTL